MIGDLSFFLILCIALFVFQRLSEGIKAQMKLETVNLCGFIPHRSAILLGSRERLAIEVQGPGVGSGP